MNKKIEWTILKTYSENEKPCFSYDDAVEEFQNIDKRYLQKVLSGMVRKGSLIRLSRGLYHIVPLNESAENFIPDWHLVAGYLLKGREYYIGYYSAMQIHGLITQPSLKEIIVTKVQIKPNILMIQNTEFQFVHHIPKRFFGYSKRWINDYDKVICSDLEKTLIDVLTKPHLGGGMVEIGKAIYETKDNLSQSKLLDYFAQNDSQAAIKRYLFLCDLLDIWSDDHERLMVNLGNSIPLLDTSAPDQGKIKTKFKLKINVDSSTIQNAIFT